jgi:two-component system OmpR family sensor kinase
VLLRTSFQLEPAWLILILGVLLGLATALVQRFVQQVHRRAAETSQQVVHSLEQDRRQFVQRLDHELKNPITAIQIQLDNLAAESNLRAGSVEELRKQAARLARLTRGLRNLSDLQIRPLEFETFEVAELMGEVLDLIEAPQRVRLEIQQTPWPPPPLRGDRELLLIMFRNLVQNSLKYSSDEVQILTRVRSDHLVVDIIDTGRGIPEQDLPFVTDELFRGSNAHDVAGSGLGLSIAERIIERHGGQITIGSRPQQGTIVSIDLPYEI